MLQPRSMHPAEIHNRETKVWSLVRFLRQIGITANDAAHMDDAAWQAAARAAEVNEPSEISRRFVVAMLSGSKAPEVMDPSSSH